MSELPWVRFFPSDWLAGTRGMSAAETGIYITLIASMYERGEPVPEDHKRLARLCGASASAFKQALDTLIEEGKISRVDGGLWNDRVGKESEIRSEKSEVGRRAGQASGRARNERNYELRRRRLADARAMASHTPDEWNALFLACGSACVDCGSTEQIEKDHIHPIYQGGSDGVENLQPLCRSCNAGKGPEAIDKRPHGWREAYASIIEKDNGNQHQIGTSVQQSLLPRSTSQKPDTRKTIEPIAQQPIAAAPREYLLDHICKAIGADISRPPMWALDLRPITDLIAKSYDLHRDILPTIVAKNRPGISKAQYFVSIIVDEVAKRDAIPQAPVKASEDWAGRLAVFRQSGTWGAWGPKPGESGCRVPPELMREVAA